MKCKNLLVSLLFISSCFCVMSQNTSRYNKRYYTQNSDTLLYRIMYPVNFSKEKQYPVVLFLHGAGERGNDNVKQLSHGASLFSSPENLKNFPAIVIFPQCPSNDYWANISVDRTKDPKEYKFLYDKPPTKSLSLVMKLLEDVLSNTFVNKNQVYVMGLSMGGMGTFEILYRKPKTFAAAIPICGGGDPNKVKEYAKNVNLWVFHGANDNVVNPLLSINMVSGIIKAGGKPMFNLYDHANHNSWDSAFAEKELFQWLFSKKIKVDELKTKK